ncbi:MAG TPA: hypothetical protein VFS21_35715 [Roseiflexaceae bacterium]|nr:hypothetical protein [Roseiflexaceae bacterium]
MPTSEDIREQLSRLSLHRANVSHYLNRRIMAGGKMFSSAEIENSLLAERREIARIKAVLRSWGATVEDSPIDIEPPDEEVERLLAVALQGRTSTSNSAAQQRPVDVLIIAPLREERDAVLRLLPAYRKLPPSASDIWVYYEALLPVMFPDGTSGDYRLIVTSPASMGRTQAASLTGDALARWQPRYVLLVGIAGGAGDPQDGATGGVSAKGVRVGDVLVAELIVDYEFQKLTPQKADIRWMAYQVDQRLLIAAHNFENPEWLHLITEPRPMADTPQVRFGPIASGDKVIAYRAGLEAVREVWSKLIGVEMEAGGVALRASQSVNRPGFFMVRGVSDLADEHKNSAEVDAWRAYACDIAAAYAIGLLKSGPIPL